MSRLLDEALPLDAAGRRAWLESRRQKYPDLAPALWEALLPDEAHAAASGSPRSLPKLVLPVVTGALAIGELQAGARVGPYELVRPLGAGGMAQVWLARRADGAFKREVALKLPALTHLRAEIEQRFARERDILASLEHPHIARFYDAGVDAAGLPYLALEYVRGETLTEWCDAHRLPISSRLELFLQVLDAVQYAHTKHVVHRDLKPSNILVNHSGEVQLLDFGVAKLLEAEEADHAQLTSVYGRALTPDYASPELLRGDPIDARSDVYSLGVVLYELLTGVRPYQLQRAASMGMLEQAIDTVEVRKPCTGIEPAAAAARASTVQRLSRQVRGDLDAIALKALAKDPPQRYPSAGTLAQELRRHLEGRPVDARSARVAYRLRKFVWRHGAMIAISAVAAMAILAAGGYALHARQWRHVRLPHEAAAVTAAPAPAPFTPPPHSIAVLPFVNLSGDEDQEYFSEGLTEEILNSLTDIEGLQVSGRMSAFSFQGKDTDLGTIARKLDVGAILEGSVRRSGRTVRITVQLIDAVTGFEVWSKSYDRNLGDVLKLQTDIATAVAGALKVTLLGDLSARIELGGTRNPAALDAYLRASKAIQSLGDHPDKDLLTAIDSYTEAIHLDPKYALAFAGRSSALSGYARGDASVLAGTATIREDFDEAEADARRAIALAPALPQAHLALAEVLADGKLDFAQANKEYERALALAPGNAQVLRESGNFATFMGQFHAAIAATRRAVLLDPLSFYSRFDLGVALFSARRYREAVAAFTETISLNPEYGQGYGQRGLALLELGDLAGARASCESESDFWVDMQCLAVVYEKLGRHADAQAELAKLKAADGDDTAYQYAAIYAQWGDPAKALQWLDTAVRLRDPGLNLMKTDPLMDPLRQEPRFQAILRQLNFPQD